MGGMCTGMQEACAQTSTTLRKVKVGARDSPGHPGQPRLSKETQPQNINKRLSSDKHTQGPGFKSQHYEVKLKALKKQKQKKSIAWGSACLAETMRFSACQVPLPALVAPLPSLQTHINLL